MLLVLQLIKKKSLPTKIIIGMILGIAAGIVFKDQAASLKPIGTIFIRMISLIVVPLVFVSLFLGTASMGDLKKLGRIGGKTLLYYITTTLVAIIIGLTLVNIVQPGKGIQLEAQYQDVTFQQPGKNISIVDNLINIIPTNPVRALVEGNMLQIIFLAILFGIAVTTISDPRRQTLINWFDSVNEGIFNVIHMVMKIAPLGVFALICSTIGMFGFDVLVSLLKYGLLVIIGLMLHASVIISVAVKMIGKVNPLKFWSAIRPAMLVAFSTSSSNATLPVTMESVEKKLNVPRVISSFVLPLGATINMDGTALYQCISIFFIAQVYGVELSLAKMVIIVLSVVLASIGTAGAPMAGVLILVMILQSIGVPTEGIAMIMGIERLMDMTRTTVNIIGDASAAVVMTQLEK
ncbi:MAG: dicarboxylate/amino acid:cation symporter [bacterium]|nr:dicarboxylate/amino acid:cation symporter [bacterium]